MKIKEFRAVMADCARDLDEIEGAILGARNLGDPVVLRDTQKIRSDILDYQGRLLEEFWGIHATAMGNKKGSIRPFPGPHDSPSQIWVQMEIVIRYYWDRVREHDEVDPALSSEVLTAAYKRLAAIWPQKLLIAQHILKERDPDFWTEDMERQLQEVLTHAKQVLDHPFP